MAYFSERLSSLIMENGLNTFALSKQVNVSVSVASNWLKKGCNPTLRTLVKLADYFSCSIDYLIGIDDDYSKYTFNPTPDFAPQLKSIVEASNQSIYRICKETGLNWVDFWYWYKGTVPKMNSLITLANYFDISVDKLVGRSYN